MNEKVILTDCDGVLLDWAHGFNIFMKELGHNIVNPGVYNIGQQYDMTYEEGRDLIEHFNRSACMRYLTPFRDSFKYVRKLHEVHGYVFHVITSQTDNIFAKKLREQNLKSIFGNSVFEEIIILSCGADKDDVLSKYRDTGCWWIEDKDENADVGIELGLNSILLAHGHNKNYEGQAVRVNDWREIYNQITGE
jgi:hypothetical protein